MTVDIIQRLARSDPMRDAIAPPFSAPQAVALRESISARGHGLDHPTPGSNRRLLRLIAVGVAAPTVVTVTALLSATADRPERAYAVLRSAIDATDAVTSGRLTTTVAETDPPAILSSVLQFDHDDYAVVVDNPPGSSAGNIEDFEFRQVNGVNYSRDDLHPWSVSTPPSDSFNAARLLSEQAAALDALAVLQPCPEDPAAFCGVITSADLVNRFLLLDLGASVEGADVRVEIDNGLIATINLHITREPGDTGLTVRQSYDRLNEPQGIVAPDIAG